VDRSLLSDFQLDWRLAGKAEQTAKNYVQHLNELLDRYPDPTLSDVKTWLTHVQTPVARRKRGQAVRAFGKWAQDCEYEVFGWWKQVPLAREPQHPQQTVTEADYKKALTAASTRRDKALIEVLWSCGLRRSEIARLQVEDVNLGEGYLVVRTSKTGRPRIVPLSPSARHALRRHLMHQSGPTVFGMTTNAIRLRLQRLGSPSAHAWRRGWAVHSLRHGVSEASVRTVAGWSSGAMVSRYTKALSSELAVDEYSRLWGSR
jgi:integrase